MTTHADIGHGTLFKLWDDELSPPDYRSVAEVTKITPFAIARESVDVTHTESPDRIREFIPGLVDYGNASIEMNFVPGSDADQRMRALFETRELSRCQLSFPTSPPTLMNFFALATAYEPDAPIEGKMTASATFKISGKPVWPAES